MASKDKLSIKVDGKDHEVFMSFGLLNKLSSMVGDPSRIGAMTLDYEMRNEVLMELLATRKPSGKIIHPIDDLDDVDVSVEDVELVLDWAAKHVMGFFMRRLQKTVDLTKEHQDQMKDLVSFLDGSAA